MTTGIDYYITMVSKIKSFVNTKGSSLSLPAHGRVGAMIHFLLFSIFQNAAKNFAGSEAADANNFQEFLIKYIRAL